MLSKLLQDAEKKPNPLLTRQIADQICRFINERRLDSGEKIPNEFELAQLFQAGRGTVREAVKLLISRNILEIRRGKGTYVCKNPGVVDDPFGFHYHEDKMQLIADLTSVRCILEPEIAALAAKYTKVAEIDQMRHIAKAIEDQIKKNQDFIDNDIAFHILIANCSRNMVMPNLIPVISYGIDLYNHSLEQYEILKATSTHTAIIDAIEAHNPDAARTAMKKHLEFNRKNVQRLLNSRKKERK